MKILRYFLLALTVVASTHLVAMDQVPTPAPTPQQTMTLEKYRLLKQIAQQQGVPQDVVKGTISSHRTPADIFAYVSTLDEDRIKEIFDAENDKPESIRKMALRLAYAKKFGKELDDDLECVDFVRGYKNYGVNGGKHKNTKLFSRAYLSYVLPLLEPLIGKPVTKLYLTYNQLTELPESISSLSNLEWLWLSGNKLTELPESISSLSKLKRLDLHGNQLTAEEKERVEQLFIGRNIDLKL